MNGSKRVHPTDLKCIRMILRPHALQRGILWRCTAVCAAVLYLSLGQPVSHSPVSRQRASARQHEVPQTTQRAHAQRRRALPGNNKQVRFSILAAQTHDGGRTNIHLCCRGYLSAVVVNLHTGASASYCSGHPIVGENLLPWWSTYCCTRRPIAAAGGFGPKTRVELTLGKRQELLLYAHSWIPRS